MPLKIEPMVQSTALNGRFVFLSASIPDPSRWEGPFEPYEITAAVVGAAKAILTASGRIVCAAHPTIAPLLVTVANGFPPNAERPHVMVYQSELFWERIPPETHELARDGIGELRWTKAVDGEDPDGPREESLKIMRWELLKEADPAAAIFIGGMDGVVEEFTLFRKIYEQRPVYPLGRPGGAAQDLVTRIDSPLAKQLAESDVYPALMQQIVEDLAKRLHGE